MAVVSAIGYFTSYNNLKDSVQQELQTAVKSQSNALDGWLHTKAQPTVDGANILTSLNGNISTSMTQSILDLSTKDNEILNMVLGTQSGTYLSRKNVNAPTSQNLNNFSWYSKAQSANKLIFTEATKENGTLIAFAAAPFYDANNNFAGVFGSAISLNSLNE